MKKHPMMLPITLVVFLLWANDSMAFAGKAPSHSNPSETPGFVTNELPDVDAGAETDIREPSEKYKGNDAVTSTFNQTVELKDSSQLQRVGAAADGVTRLAIILQSDKTLRISLPDPKDGAISTLQNQAGRGNADLVISPTGYGTPGPNQKKYIVFLYYAPDGYGNDPLSPNGRDVKITAAVSATEKSDIVLKINTPPVVLIHGIWSSGSVWKEGGFRKYLKAQNFTNLESVNYESSSSWLIGSASENRSPGVQQLRGSKDNALKRYTDLQIAATQVDVVAHSMGGLMTRTLIQSDGYKTAGNYQKGSVHKLLTLGTPHYGSALANTLWNHRKDWLVKHVLPIANMAVKSAIKDLRQGSNGLSFLNATTVKGYAIGGSYKTGEESADDHMNFFLKFVSHSLPELDVIHGDEHDVIVPSYSQKGGVADDYFTRYSGTIHSQIPDGRTNNTETNSADIKLKVKDLLLSNALNAFTPSFPKPVLYNPPNYKAAEKAVNGFSNPASSLRSAVTVSPTGKIKIVSPVRGSIYSSQSDSVTLEFVTTGSVSPVGSAFLVGTLDILTVPGDPPYRVRFKLPNDVPIGKLAIAALSTDASGKLLADTSFILVQLTGTVANFSVEPDVLKFDSLYRQQPLSVTTDVTNGSDATLANLTNAETGTTYTARKGSAVIRVDGNGMVTALSTGRDTIDVRNGNLAVAVPVYVNSVCSISKPVISIAGNTLISSSATGNLWYLDDVPIDNATGNTHQMTEPGTYSVQVASTCASLMSDVVQRKAFDEGGLLVGTKAFLQGAYDPAAGLMWDSLRMRSFLPKNEEPYRSLGFQSVGNSTFEAPLEGVFDSTGGRAVTDWVWLELRSALNPVQVVATRSAFITRDGNVVDMDGISPVRFNGIANGSYYLALRHRNHLGVMTASAIALNDTASTNINFTSPSTPTYGINARKNINGVMVLWGGDANGDGKVSYTGPGNDRAVILTNIGGGETGTLSGYRLSDLNLNGQAKYSGPGNDRAFLLSAALDGDQLLVRTQQFQ